MRVVPRSFTMTMCHPFEIRMHGRAAGSGARRLGGAHTRPVAPKLRCCVRAATRRRASPGPADDPYLAAASATAEELVSAIGLESRNARSGRHVESLEHLSCVDIDVPQIAVLAFPRGMPEFAVHPGDASDKAVGFDRPKNGARLRIDLMDLPVAMLPHP